MPRQVQPPKTFDKNKTVILSEVRRDLRAARIPRIPSFSGFGTTGACFGICVLLFLSASSAQDFPTSSQSSKTTASSVTYLFPEQISIPAGKSTAVDLHFRVADGLHINSHNPREKSLIPTNLAVVEQDGFKVSAVDFPAGTDYSFAFDPKEKLSVYTGEFVLRAHLMAPAGEHLLEGALRYQACNSNSCYPPKTIPVAVDVIAK
jgi:hypothetical protein